MKIAIISDVHDNIPNLKKILNYCIENKIEKIICCGDLASLETLDFINDNFPGEILYTFGNMDNDYLKNYPFENDAYKQTKIFKSFGETIIADKKIAFVHFPDKARELCESGKYDFVFHGHTHMPWEETIGKCKMLNPGNVANQRYAPTFAVWEIEKNKFNLIRINELS
ncbi:MAG: metallophosphoesterase family protein [Patescibacteria group bacterium]|jgi:putative phosphoesterase